MGKGGLGKGECRAACCGEVVVGDPLRSRNEPNLWLRTMAIPPESWISCCVSRRQVPFDSLRLHVTLDFYGWVAKLLSPVQMQV